jgi:hypothetical protein
LEAPDLIHQGKHLINIAHFSNTDGHSSRQALKLLPIYITEVRKGHFTTRLDDLSDFLLPWSHFNLLGMVEILEILIIIFEILQMENTHRKTKLLLGDPSVSL